MQRFLAEVASERGNAEFVYKRYNDNCYIANSIKAELSIEPERISGLRSEGRLKPEYMS